MNFHVRKDGITLQEIMDLSPCESGLKEFMLWLVERGEKLGSNDKVPEALIRAALKHDETWVKWAKEEKVIDMSHEKINLGHIYRAKKLYQGASGKLYHFLVFEEPDCDFLYLIDIETGESDPVDAIQVYSDDDEYYSASKIEEEINIKLIKDLGPLHKHLKVSALK